MNASDTPDSAALSSTVSATRPALDLERVNRLVADLEAEVAKAPPDAPGMQDLRDEIETLKNVLGSPKTKHDWIEDGLRAVRDAAQAVKGEVMRESVYIAEIGRILGL